MTEICENCGRTEDKHFSILKYCSEAEFEDFQELEPQFKPKTNICENCGHLKRLHQKERCIGGQFKCPCKKFKAKTTDKKDSANLETEEIIRKCTSFIKELRESLPCVKTRKCVIGRDKGPWFHCTNCKLKFKIEELAEKHFGSDNKVNTNTQGKALGDSRAGFLPPLTKKELIKWFKYIQDATGYEDGGEIIYNECEAILEKFKGSDKEIYYTNCPCGFSEKECRIHCKEDGCHRIVRETTHNPKNQAIRILINRHAEEYEAILKKRKEIYKIEQEENYVNKEKEGQNKGNEDD
jgi:hypothetical protein